jgi:hypothetical protein
MPDDKPWLQEPNWANNNIASDARRAHWALWLFALCWNGLTLPLFLQGAVILNEIQRKPIVALVLLFPLVGMGLLAAAVQATRRKRRFGATALTMDPFPGSLGGHVGGTIDTNIPFSAGQQVNVQLSCLHSYISGSGKNRSRSESVKWHSDGICHTERFGSGTRLRFRFDVPKRLPPSDMATSGNYNLWRLRVATELDGPDFDRSYRIPVFPTGLQSEQIADATESHPATIDTALAGIESIARIRPVPGGMEAWFPALQRPAQGIFALLFGLTFTAIGLGLGLTGESLFLGGIFTLIGGLIACYGAWYLGKALLVSVTQQGVKTRRFLFGYPLRTRQLAAADLRAIEIRQGATMRSGNKTTVYYQLIARGSGDGSLAVAERLTSRAEAELLQESYKAYLGRG